ncbi:MAG: peptidoglycan-binding protein [Sarcina sp.]
MINTGNLKVHCFYEDTYLPLPKVMIKIFESDEDFNNVKELKTVETNQSGYVDNIELESAEPDNTKVMGAKPYGIYNLYVSKVGYKSLVIKGVQVFPGRKAIQHCRLEKGDEGNCASKIVTIPEHKQVKHECSKCQNTCKGTQTLKLEKEYQVNKKKNKRNKNVKEDKNFRVLQNVEVPQFITVHAGSPTNSAAENYTVPFIDYIKNVGSSELYSTWDASALRANIYCIVSFVLNRVYTEWYPSRGYNFDITNDTAYDQAFVPGRTTYDSINIIVDQLFSTYIQRWGQKEPLLAEFCNGTTSVCPGWLSQWGSQYLAQQGYYPYEILTNYYGNDINLTEATQVAGYPNSYPGYPLTLWTSGANVLIIQKQLNQIGQNYPAIASLEEDGIYGPKTEASVKTFQGIFDVPQTGIVNRATWYAISRVYVGVTKDAALNQ